MNGGVGRRNIFGASFPEKSDPAPNPSFQLSATPEDVLLPIPDGTTENGAIDVTGNASTGLWGEGAGSSTSEDSFHTDASSVFPKSTPLPTTPPPIVWPVRRPTVRCRGRTVSIDSNGGGSAGYLKGGAGALPLGQFSVTLVRNLVPPPEEGGDRGPEEDRPPLPRLPWAEGEWDAFRTAGVRAVSRPPEREETDAAPASSARAAPAAELAAPNLLSKFASLWGGVAAPAVAAVVAVASVPRGGGGTAAPPWEGAVEPSLGLTLDFQALFVIVTQVRPADDRRISTPGACAPFLSGDVILNIDGTDVGRRDAGQLQAVLRSKLVPKGIINMERRVTLVVAAGEGRHYLKPKQKPSSAGSNPLQDIFGDNGGGLGALWLGDEFGSLPPVSPPPPPTPMAMPEDDGYLSSSDDDEEDWGKSAPGALSYYLEGMASPRRANPSTPDRLESIARYLAGATLQPSRSGGFFDDEAYSALLRSDRGRGIFASAMPKPRNLLARDEVDGATAEDDEESILTALLTQCTANEYVVEEEGRRRYLRSAARSSASRASVRTSQQKAAGEVDVFVGGAFRLLGPATGGGTKTEDDWRERLIGLLERHVDELEQESVGMRATDGSGGVGDPRRPPPPMGGLDFLGLGKAMDRILSRQERSLPPPEVTRDLADVVRGLRAVEEGNGGSPGGGADPLSRAAASAALAWIVDMALPRWIETWKPLGWNSRGKIWPLDASSGGDERKSSSQSRQTRRPSWENGKNFSIGGSLDGEKDEEEAEIGAGRREHTCFLMTYYFCRVYGKKTKRRTTTEGSGTSVVTTANDDLTTAANNRPGHTHALHPPAPDFVRKFGSYLGFQESLSAASAACRPETVALLLELAPHDPAHLRASAKFVDEDGEDDEGGEAVPLSVLLQYLNVLVEDEIMLELLVGAYPSLRPWQVREAAVAVGLLDGTEEYYSYLSLLLDPEDGAAGARADGELVMEWCMLSLKKDNAAGAENFRTVALCDDGTFTKDIRTLIDLSMGKHMYDAVLSLGNQMISQFSREEFLSYFRTFLTHFRDLSKAIIMNFDSVDASDAPSSPENVLHAVEVLTKFASRAPPGSIDIQSDLSILLETLHAITDDGRRAVAQDAVVAALGRAADPAAALATLWGQDLWRLPGSPTPVVRDALRELLRRSAARDLADGLSGSLLRIGRARTHGNVTRRALMPRRSKSENVVGAGNPFDAGVGNTFEEGPGDPFGTLATPQKQNNYRKGAGGGVRTAGSIWEGLLVGNSNIVK